MSEVRVRLTDDPLTNIHIMVSMMNDEQRKAISQVMFGCFLGQELARDKTTEKR